MAQIDLDEIWLYSKNYWGLNQADKYYKNIISTFEDLVQGYKKGLMVEVFPSFEKYLCGAHVLYFKITSNHLDIIRILHQKQDVEVLKNLNHH